MNKFPLRSCIVLGGLITLTITATTSYAQTVFSSNFECDCWTEWSWNPTISSSGRDSIVNDGSNFGGAHSTWSAQTLYPAGGTDEGGSGWSNIGLSVLPSEFLIEYDFKLSSNFHFPLGQKMWRTMPDMNTGQGSNDTVANMQMNGYGTTLTFEVFSNSTSFGNQEYTIFANINKPPVNTWHRIGWRFKKNTFSGSTPNEDGQTEIFLDGVSVGSRSDVRLTASPTRWFRDYWGGPGNYTSVVDNNPVPQDQWIRVDNFRITDLTGTSAPTSPSPSAPIAPTNLAVQ